MKTIAMLDELRSLIGEGNVLADRGALARYESDGRGATGSPLAVLRPGSTQEVSAIVRHAAALGLGIVPQGGRTGLVGAGVAGGNAVVISLERLAAPPTIDAANRTAEADAGVLLSTLNEAAVSHGLFFPIDLGADPSVGGMIAANTGGARFLRHGDVRRNLLGLELVMADKAGTIVKLGGPLWKNNTGLDLKQLLVGSSGSLGIVTRATLALSPKPQATVTAMLALVEPEAGLDLLGALENAFGTLLTAFEGMSAPALAAALRHLPRLRDPFPGTTPTYAVLIELSAGSAFSEAVLEEMLAKALEPWFESGRIVDTALDRRDGLWAIRHAVPEGLRASGKVVACDIALRRGDVMRFRQDVGNRLVRAVPQLQLHDFGHIGDGGLHFNLVWPPEAGSFDPAAAERARDIVFTAVVDDYGGSFSAEHGIGPANAAYYRRFVPEPVRRLSGAVQRLFAPVPLGRVDFATGSDPCPTI